MRVSVLCMTFNQVGYIEQCLDSMLNQKTTFKYEIIVHDDASNDGTAEVVKQYAKKYPDKIIPIFEDENQYSKDVHSIFRIMLPYSSGEYVALCEGDDYWTDKLKLQRQYDYMEKNHNCSFCFHNADNLYMDSGKRDVVGDKNIFGKYKTDDNIYSPANINMCKFATQNAVPTASVFFRKKLAEDMPDCFYVAPCVDFPLEMILAHRGYAFYMPISMSVYRRNAGGSVTDGWKRNAKRAVSRSKQFLKFLDEFNIYSDKRYEDSIDFLKKRYYMDIYIARKEPLKIVCNKEYREIYKGLYGKRWWMIKIVVKSLCPNFAQRLRVLMIKFGS